MSSTALSVDELVKLAEQAFDEFSPGVAAKYYEDAIHQEPQNALLHHKLGIMYVEHGEPELAHKAFLKSIELSPNENESNYLYIAQQCYGNAAKSAFEKGIDLMKNKLETLQNSKSENKEKEIHSLKSEISSAYVSIAELFMTDLCESEDAETQCERNLKLSLQFDADNVESYATFGEFKHCQQNDVEAIKYFGIALKKLFTNHMDDKLDIFGENALLIDSFLKIIKLGIELEQYNPSLTVLKGLINANDGLGECWALGALCFYKLNKNQDAAIWLNNAETILKIESGSTLNFELQHTLEAVKAEMNIEQLPDITKLKLNDVDVDDEDNEKIDTIDDFLEDDDDDDDDNEDIDIETDNMIDID